jgi:hypothetical protein
MASKIDLQVAKVLLFNSSKRLLILFKLFVLEHDFR